MKQALHTLRVRTAGQDLYDITQPIGGWVGQQGIDTGLLTIWCRHTSASLIVQENADPDVRADLVELLPRGGAGGKPVPPYDRGTGRNAGAHQGRPDTNQPIDSVATWRAAAGHLAG